MRATSEKRLITMLLENYKQNGIDGRPVINTTRSISIGVGFSLLQILDFNQDKQSINLVGWISLVNGNFSNSAISLSLPA